MLNAEEMQDALMGAQALVHEVINEIMSEWAEPMILQQIAMFWAAMPPDAKEDFKNEQPEAYEELVSKLGTISSVGSPVSRIARKESE